MTIEDILNCVKLYITFGLGITILILSKKRRQKKAEEEKKHWLDYQARQIAKEINKLEISENIYDDISTEDLLNKIKELK